MTEYDRGLPSNSACCCREAIPPLPPSATERNPRPGESLSSAERELVQVRRQLEQQGAALLETQRELFQTQARCRRFYDEIPLAALTLDAQGWICDLNRAAAALLGEPATALVGRPFAGFLAATDRHKFLRHLHAALQLPQETACELSLAGEAGPERVVQLDLVPTPTSPVQLRATLSELTALRQAEAALAQSEARFHVTFDSAGVGIAHVALDGSWLLVNPRFAEIVGYSAEELRQQSFHDLTHREDLSVHLTYFTALAHGTLRGYSQEKRLRHRQGHCVWVESAAVLQRHPDGLPHYSIHVVHDISQRKQAEADLKAQAESLEERAAERAALAQRRAQQLRALVAELTVAEQRERRRLAQLLHDHLQQHLVALRLKVHGLCRRTEEPALLEGLQGLDVLLNESIDTSRGLTYELSPPILHHDGGLNAALTWLARGTHEKHGLAVEVVAACDPEPLHPTQRLLLFEGVRELLFNVVKHAGVAKARVEVSESGEQVEVVVSDAGLGFDPAQSARSDDCASGFGLFNVRERLEWLGGSLHLDSAPGQGTRVTMRIPRGMSASDAEAAPRPGEP